MFDGAREIVAGRMKESANIRGFGLAHRDRSRTHLAMESPNDLPV